MVLLKAGSETSDVLKLSLLSIKDENAAFRNPH
jgi:hypothetical protein